MNKRSSKYAAYCGDVWSQKYRCKFINEPMFTGLTLSGMKIVEAMCGSGGYTG